MDSFSVNQTIETCKRGRVEGRNITTLHALFRKRQKHYSLPALTPSHTYTYTKHCRNLSERGKERVAEKR